MCFQVYLKEHGLSPSPYNMLCETEHTALQILHLFLFSGFSTLEVRI